MTIKAALIIQPATIISGGGQILKIIGQVIAEHHAVEFVYLSPSRNFASDNTLRYIKNWLKIFNSLLRIPGNLRVMRPDQLCEYDRIFVGWVGDLSQLLQGGIPSDRIIHICQSIETWSSDTTSACVAYSSSIERWFVADWLARSLSNVTEKSFTIGNAIADVFFDVEAVTSWHSRRFVTYLTHPGWWKGVPECAIVAESISRQTGLEIQTFGKFRTGREHVSHLRPNTRSVVALLDQSQVFVAMSLYEGMPLVAIEALARGCKLVLSDIPAHREIWRYVGDQHCRLLTAPPVDFCKLYQIDWLSFIGASTSVPGHVKEFRVSAFRKRVNDSYYASLGMAQANPTLTDRLNNYSS